MWVARIARPGAVYDASEDAQTFDAIGEFRENESDFEEKVAGVIGKALAAPGYPSIPGYREFQRNARVGKVNLLKTRGKAINLKRSSKCRVFVSKRRLRN